MKSKKNSRITGISLTRWLVIVLVFAMVITSVNVSLWADEEMKTEAEEVAGEADASDVSDDEQEMISSSDDTDISESAISDSYVLAESDRESAEVRALFELSEPYASVDEDNSEYEIVEVSGFAGSSDDILMGSCGSQVTYELNLDTGVLVISGTGAMTDYDEDTYTDVPWYGYRYFIYEIEIEEGVTHIGDYAFVQASAESVSFPSSLTSIGEVAFCECGELQTIEIPDNVTSIGMAAFADCSSVESIVLGASVTTIGDYAFQRVSITTLTIPASVTSIGELICYGSSTLNAYEVASGNKYYTSEDGVLFNKKKTTLIAFPIGKSSSYTIPDTVTLIEDCAFYMCSNVTKITIPSSVTTIGDWVFNSCTSLTTLTIPNSVTSIGYGILQNCTSLKTVTVGSGVETLMYLTFSGCSSLTKVTLKKGLKIIDMLAFDECTSLSTITMPSSLTTIGYQAFYGCVSLTTLTIPDSVTSIEDDAFEKCTNLKLTLPSTLKQMENGSYIAADEVSVTGTLDYTKAYEVLTLVNKERAAEGLSSLTMDEDLLEAAMQRAAETSVYFSHTRPCGLDCFTAADKIYGENIAVGQSTASSVMDSWMNSSGHRANILTSSYTIIGIGCFIQDGMTYWVQVFGYDTASTLSKPSNSTKSMTVVIDLTAFSSYVSMYATTTSLVVGKKTTYEMYLINPEWTYAGVTLDASSFTWSSGSTSVATVSKKGVVKAKGAGSAKIKAVSAGGALSASKTVKVTCATPKISSISNTSSGVKLKWSAVSGAAKYQIWRKTSSGSWTKLGTTTSTSYTDKTAKAGTTYSYRMRCVKSNGTTSTSSYSSSKKIRRLTNGKISSLTNTSSGIKIKWSKVTGASGYYVYRKTGSDSYSRIKIITSVSTLTYTDTSSKLTNGTTYTYCVKPYYKSGSTTYTGSYTAKTTVRLKAVSISSVKNSSSKKMVVKWSKNSKASGYQIQYSTSSSFPSGSKTTSVYASGASTLSKKVTKLTKGKTYYVRVRAYKTVNGTKYYSAWSKKKSVKISK